MRRAGLLSSSGAQASHCGGLPCCRAQALGHTGSAVVVHGVSCPKVCGLLTTRDHICVPSIDRWVLNRWTTRKALNWHPEALQNDLSKLTEVNKPLQEDEKALEDPALFLYCMYPTSFVPTTSSFQPSH